MELKNPAFSQPRPLVEVVYVLGDDTVQSALPLQLGNGVVGGVGLSLRSKKPLPLQTPVLPPGLWVPDELLVGKVAGVVPVPDTT